MKGKTEEKKTVSTNRKAWFHYEILEEYEAGLSLLGPEVKSLRTGQVSLEGSFARIENEEGHLHNMYIAPYKQNTLEEISPTRTRKLLLKHREIKRLIGRMQTKGLSLIPLEVYFKGSWAKVRLGMAKSKRGPDKREKLRKQDTAREMERSFKNKFKL